MYQRMERNAAKDKILYTNVVEQNILYVNYSKAKRKRMVNILHDMAYQASYNACLHREYGNCLENLKIFFYCNK